MASERRILLVEDDEDQRVGLAELLRREGYAVTEAEDAEMALERLQTEAFDLLVSDYQLGGATGTWLARVAAQSLRHAAQSILIVTAHDLIADVDGLTVLHKPLDIDRFMSEVKQALVFRATAETEPRTAAQRVALILYINNALPSQRTRKTLQTVLDEYDPAQVAFTVVDLSADTAHQAEQHRVVATPTLLKTFPAPRVWIAGEFAERDLVRRMLDQAGVERR
jgi:CheY-like chemotaxis protein